MERSFDIVLLGATGFTGGLTADYLAANMPADGRWALAGRNLERLEAVRDRLGFDVPLLRADVTDAGSLRELAESTRVVATTVGPYIDYGEPLVAACAEAGTHYADLTGEPEFVDLMYLKHHARAVETGARLVHACGFDSIPHDLGVYFTVQRLPADVPVHVSGYVRVSATVSGGTYRSALTAFSRGRETMRAHRRRRRAEPPLEGRRARAVQGRPHRNAGLGAWALPLPTIDPDVVRRSAVALPSYGPDFSYSHFVAVKHLPSAAGLAAGAAGLVTAAQVPPVRNWLLGRIQPGEGPSSERRAKSWFSVHFAGEAGGEKVVTKVTGGDPGYDETAKMLAESAMSLAYDDLPKTAGQVTTAEAMGDALLPRLQRAGMTFSVVGRRP
ncbi:saccharopine dehydrogenase NADP-binding domain-containing protein [Actinomadura sp. DC4]|uniref:saccharopine dehydrogenase family protein n=1 Tax=Actinomadura sp. DC4 TaxID=3055069 RepID=UPI0025AEF76E|nr:saccharopine dehydrogenase NADP-binding domain-containing protein [Actinomadura sp. DC4]MDN3356737.1 saccharopine dehydrogenase NADP-binding domain-containing protein [Actinomadura sp. DC4]